jgi:hypothetical protein
MDQKYIAIDLVRLSASITVKVMKDKPFQAVMDVFVCSLA